jgi:hypothetical protein
MTLGLHLVSPLVDPVVKGAHALNLRLIMRGFGWLTLALLLAVTGTARAQSGQDGLRQVVDGYAVTLVFDSPTVQPGSNDVIVTIHDRSGAPVSGATVSAAVLAFADGGDSHSDTHGASGSTASHTDSHGDDHSTDGRGREAIPLLLEPTVDSGVYSGRLLLDEAGIATLTVVFTLQNTTRAVIFDVPVIPADYRALLLGGFAAVHAVILGSAAWVRSRRSRLTMARRRNPQASLSRDSAQIQEHPR